MFYSSILARKLSLGLMVFPLLLGCTGTDVPDDVTDETITLALNWYPDSQHGGFYAAEYFGFFKDEGLQVKIEPGGPGAPVVQNVGLGRVAFGVGNADQILLAREQQIPLVALMASMQNSPRCLMVHQESGITSFEQLKGIKLALGAGKSFAKFLSQDGVLKDVQVVPYTGSVAPFLADPQFGQQAYVFSEPYVVEQRGAHPVCLMVSDRGFNPYSSILFTNEELLQEKPEVVAKIVRAVRRGWLAYLNDPEPVNQKIQKDNPEMNLEALSYGAKAIADLCLPAALAKADIGTMTDARWDELKQQLTEIELVSEDLSPSQSYSLQFLQPLEASP